MAAILKVRDADGTVHEIHALQGKSAYAYAVEGGYTGTEAVFAAKLAQETYSKTEIDNIMGSYINDIDSLIGGNS